MEIRSVTLFCDADFDEQTAGQFWAEARQAFGRPVQTTRLALPPFPTWQPAGQPIESAAQQLAERWQTAGADYISLGPVRLADDDAWLDMIPDLLAATGVLFANVEVAGRRGQIDGGRCAHLARVIHEVSRIIPNGFGNLYLTAIAHCPPGSPFFPVAYHAGGPAGFALALEAADLALTAVKSAGSLAQARRNLIAAVEKEAASLSGAAQELAAAHGIAFQGLDFSLAPFPGESQSLAGALEALGLPHLGAPGSLFAAAFVAEALGRANFARCGFSGLMLPVLEDSVLARRVADEQVRLADLLSYAAVCGVGLDTIPLPGDTPTAAIAGILLDIAALAGRLRKPLTARLMPLPGLAAGDEVAFDFPYFAGSRVMSVQGEGVAGLLANEETLEILPIGASFAS